MKQFRNYPLDTVFNKDRGFIQINKLSGSSKAPLLWLQPADWLAHLKSALKKSYWKHGFATQALSLNYTWFWI